MKARSTPPSLVLDMHARRLCECGHPRSAHTRQDDDFPAMCLQIMDPDDEAYGGVCGCLDFKAVA